MGYLRTLFILIPSLLGTQSFANLKCENALTDQLKRMVVPSYYSQTLTDQVSLSQRTPHQWTYTITTDLGVQKMKVQTHGKKVEVVLQNQNITTLPNYYPYLYSAPVRVNEKTVAKVMVRVTPGMYELGKIEVHVYQVPTNYQR